MVAGRPEQAGDVFVEASEAVRRFIVAEVGDDAILPLLERLDAEDLAYVSPSLPEHLPPVPTARSKPPNARYSKTRIQYDRNAVGYHMTREWVEVEERQTVGDVLKPCATGASCRRRPTTCWWSMPVVCCAARLTLPVLLVQPPTAPIFGLAAEEFVSFLPHDDATTAIGAFERYGLVSAPVVDERGKLVGRLTVDAVMDVMRDRQPPGAQERRPQSGRRSVRLAVGQRAQPRAMAAVNLVTAFITSRVIGQFEGSSSNSRRWPRSCRSSPASAAIPAIRRWRW